MAMSDGPQILRAIERQRDAFRLMQKGVVLDLKTGEVYEGVSDGKQSSAVRDAGRQVGLQA